jgi:hypothetical protein
MNYFDEIDIFDDGWVFLLGGSNSVRDYWINGKSINDITLERWLEVYKKRVSFFKQQNIKYLSIFAPEKLTIYSNKCSLKVNEDKIPSHQLMNYLAKEESISNVILDIIPYLRSQSETYLTYHKTDSHWNFVGAYSAYQLIQSRLKQPVFKEALAQPRNFNWNIMDLGGKFDPPLREKTFYYKSSGNFTRTYANDLVKFKEENNRENDVGFHVGSYVIYKNDKAISNKKVMIFGDSFSEYRDHLLTGLMAETYAEVHFVWSTSLDFDLILKEKPDIVISEMAERFITNPYAISEKGGA